MVKKKPLLVYKHTLVLPTPPIPLSLFAPAPAWFLYFWILSQEWAHSPHNAELVAITATEIIINYSASKTNPVQIGQRRCLSSSFNWRQSGALLLVQKWLVRLTSRGLILISVSQFHRGITPLLISITPDLSQHSEQAPLLLICPFLLIPACLCPLWHP